MRLFDLMQGLNTIEDEDQIIYAATIDGKWTLDSECNLVPIPEENEWEEEPEGMDYLLEVFLAKDLIQAAESNRKRTSLTPEEKLREILFYKEHDAPLSALEAAGYDLSGLEEE